MDLGKNPIYVKFLTLDWKIKIRNIGIQGSAGVCPKDRKKLLGLEYNLNIKK